jgi:ubiquinone/menaquinone biosynthesis C-methylase UbiE
VNEWIAIIALVLFGIGCAFLVWWLIFESEGVYLGRRVVIWLYDVYAGRYDDIKGFRRENEHTFLAQPIMERIAPNKAPLVLDVATGTGRLPLALTRHAHFQGFVVGTDLSAGMLDRAVRKLHGENRVCFAQSPAEYLPFADHTFDLVTCFESLEFMQNREQVVRELARVLRHGGLLVITNRLTGRWMPGKTWDDDQLTALMGEIGMAELWIASWQVDYDLVFAKKAERRASG